MSNNGAPKGFMSQITILCSTQTALTVFNVKAEPLSTLSVMDNCIKFTLGLLCLKINYLTAGQQDISLQIDENIAGLYIHRKPNFIA